MPDSKLSADDVAKVAKLARLSMDDADLNRLAAQLESILGYVNKINSVDLSNVQPLAHALPVHNVLREDVPGPALPLEKVLQNAPEADGAFFAVPKVIGGDEDSAG
jgi:aspartyl-tRNA(Asn)/glutamyl-tRNA(Gln) amidotransferase subunit C